MVGGPEDDLEEGSEEYYEDWLLDEEEWTPEGVSGLFIKFNQGIENLLKV